MPWPWALVVISLWAVVIVLVILHIGYFKRTANLLSQAEFQLQLATSSSGGLGGLAPGKEVPPFRVQTLDGRILESGELLRGPSVVLFMDRHCEPCRELEVQLEETLLPAGVRFLVIADGGLSVDLGFSVQVVRQIHRSASRAFSNVTSPQAFAIDGNGTVVDRLVPNSSEDLSGLASELEEEVNSQTIAR